MLSVIRISLLLIITVGCNVLYTDGFTVPFKHPTAVPGTFSSVSIKRKALTSTNYRVFDCMTFSSKHNRHLSSSSSLYSKSKEESSSSQKKDELVKAASLSLRRCSWFSWWSQIILTVVSSITLLFARGVMNAGTTQGLKKFGVNDFFLAGAGLCLSYLSILWTWGGARLARRLVRRNLSRIQAATIIRRAITAGSTINLMGMFVTLLGAQQIVGTLAAKVLTMQGISPFGNTASMAVATQTLQPLDILVVQANTNTLFSHFVSLACALYLTRSVHKLDPPSEDEQRK